MHSLVEMGINMYTKEYIENNLNKEISKVTNITIRTTSKGNKYAVFNCNKGMGYICENNGVKFGNGTWKNWSPGVLDDSLIDDICNNI